MPWGAVAGAVIGGVAASDSSRRAANTQRDAARESNDQQWRMYQQNRSDMEPWRAAGQRGLNELMMGMGVGDPGRPGGGDLVRRFGAGDFQQDPGYQFRMQEGMDQLENSAAARGGLLSGNTLAALTRYNQGFASNEYQNAYNRFTNDQSTRRNSLVSLAGIGRTANNQIGQWGQDMAARMGENTVDAGNAAAAGQIGQGNAWANAAGQIGNAWMQNQWMGNRGRGGGNGGISSSIYNPGEY
jgi:hypothetical protein